MQLLFFLFHFIDSFSFPFVGGGLIGSAHFYHIFAYSQHRNDFAIANDVKKFIDALKNDANCCDTLAITFFIIVRCARFALFISFYPHTSKWHLLPIFRKLAKSLTFNESVRRVGGLSANILCLMLFATITTTTAAAASPI